MTDAKPKTIYRAYKTELKLNNEQITACRRHAGTARFVYNWGLAQKKAALDAKQKVPSFFDLDARLTSLKRTDFAWMREVAACTASQALCHLDQALEGFFSKQCQFPRFKTKRSGTTFKLRGSIKVFADTIRLPRLGLLKLKEHGYIPTNTKILSATVSERAGHWFVSVQVEETLPEFHGKKDNHDIVGMDVGIKTLATVSDGMTFDNPKPLQKRQRKLRRLQRAFSRTKKGGKNRQKAAQKIARLHYRVANIRKDALHKMTTTLTKTKRVIGIEDLNVSGLLKNRRLSRAIGELGLYECRRQLEYKGGWYNCLIVPVDRFYPSSKTCSVCGEINEQLKLGDREWRCQGCNTHHDRDFNASCNLEFVAASSSETLNALRSEKALA